MALEEQRCSDKSSEVFITRRCKLLSRSNNDRRAGIFLQRFLMALQISNAACLQISNAACVLGAVSDRNAFEEK